MAVLNETDRADVWRMYMKILSQERQTINITKQELRAAIDAVDTWVENNTASFNTAIPQPARGSLTARQKARLLVYVVMRRFERT